MVRITLTQQLSRFVTVPEWQGEAATLNDALTQLWQSYPQLRHYIVDDQGHIREHVTVFIDSQRLIDKSNLNVVLQPSSNIYILQALSGG